MKSSASVLPAIGLLLLAAGCQRPKHAHPGGGARGSDEPVPVVAATVQARDTPIYVDSIGTVKAFNTATVHSQIDGQLQSLDFQEGQDVKAGDLLAQIDSRALRAQLDVARARKREDEAQLANARSVYDRNEALRQKGLIDQQTAESYKAGLDQLAAQVQADNANIAAARVQLGYTRITAPISGRTGLRQLDPGNIVHAGDANGLVVITQLRPISVVFTVPQQQLPLLRQATRGGPGGLTVLALDRDSRTLLDTGVLAVVDNQIDTTTGTVRLKATLPNTQLTLWPGQFVNIRLLVETRHNGIVVPASAILRGPDGTYVFVIQGDATVATRAVTVDQIEEDSALIGHGLQAGERVVTDGQYRLQAGSRVVATAPGAKAPATDSPPRSSPSSSAAH